MQFIHDIAIVISMAFHCRRSWFCIVCLYAVCVSDRGQSASGQQPGKVCQNIDIRNSVEQFKKIENCTVVEGFLQIVLIDNGTSKSYENLSFPKLREITGYLLLYRAFGMTSIGKLFPELTVIRGNVLFQNYALVIYEMFQLQEIGLKSLTNIIRGSVRIEKNPNLCYVKSIDWDLIAKSGQGGHFIKHNQPSRECPNACQSHCPLNTRSGPISQRLCWNSQWCQKVCHSKCQSANKTCDKSGFCCHKECLGGCSINDSPSGCRSCRNVVYNNKCYEKCPIGTYQHMGWRCINEDTCRNITTRLTEGKVIYWKPIVRLQSCMQDCPAGYVEADDDRHSCKKCTGHCPKVCPGTVVDSVSAAQKLSGCTMINGSLIIQINSGANIIEELEENLKYIKEITGFLKVFRSYSLVSLNFLKNLKIIHGQQRDKQSYSLLVYNNQNLEDLWNWKILNYTLQFGQGKIFFHFNPKLCVDKIKELRNYSNVRDWDDRDVSPSSNGDRVACNVTSLQVFPWLVCSNVAGIKWENFREKVGDQRSLLGYTVHYRKANEKNITMFDGRDACEMNVWKVFDVEATEDKSKEIFHIITHLEPFTQYAFYIQTYNLAQAAKGAKSEIKYFKTKPDTPSPPLNVHAQAIAIGEIRIKWQPPKRPNGNITHYIVEGKRELDFVIGVPIGANYAISLAVCINIEILDVDTHYLDTETIVIDSKEKQVVEEAIGTKHLWFNNSYKSPNVTSDTSSEEAMNGKCCPCTEKKSEKKHEVEAEDQIQFEDAIHNTVYIKNPSFSRIKGNDRPKKALHTTLSSQSFTESTVEKKSDFLNTLEPEVMTTTTTYTSKGNVTENGVYVHFSTIATHTSVTVSQLHHYTEYTIEVQACHYTDKEENTRCPFYKPCSTVAIASIRTLPLSNADDIDSATILVHPDNTSAKTVHIQWDEPKDPNGVIVSYSIEYTHLDDDNPKPAVVCITQLQYKAEKGHHLTALSFGRYSLRLQATSLAGNGNWTKYIKFTIPDNTGGLTTEVLALVVCFTVVVFLTTAMGAWIFVKRKLASRIPDDVLYASVNPEYMSTVYLPDEWEVSRDKVCLIRELGQGSFGMVWEGEAKDLVEGKPIVKCAVKTVNESASLRERIEFLQEASVMKSFNCHHVVKLLGVVSKGHPTLVIMELMTNGDLKSYLRAHRPDNEENPGKQPPTLRQFLWMAVEIADGMAYLSAKKFVHRDLAARNCMVGEDMTVKIGDFGMTRDIYETDYYRKGGKGLLPVRWMAPESLKDGVFTSQSDVWSYGVVLWEMATLASQPYRGLSNEQVVNYVVNRGVMEMPEYCPKKLYDLMRLCWYFNPKARPTFFELIEMLLPDVPDSFWNVSYYFSQRPEVITHENEDTTLSTPLKSADNTENHSQDEIDQSSGEGGVRFFPSATYIPESTHLINCSCSDCKEHQSPLNGGIRGVEDSKHLAIYSPEDSKATCGDGHLKLRTDHKH
ncbi:insulin receptor-like [Limulus polyphemus]|uniref:Tyrosine-protein kinase receptor n=1 Tax=Limulus polyphemus TaxID=6850 RepID=A0ABM1B5C5_LIMPO|nr:insulin receptor-like [Limulus polyphemus]